MYMRKGWVRGRTSRVKMIDTCSDFDLGVACRLRQCDAEPQWTKPKLCVSTLYYVWRCAVVAFVKAYKYNKSSIKSHNCIPPIYITYWDIRLWHWIHEVCFWVTEFRMWIKFPWGATEKPKLWQALASTNTHKDFNSEWRWFRRL